MTIHPPKHITTQEGLGKDTQRAIFWQATDKATTIESWGPMTEPWKEGDTVIADKDFHWVTTWEAGSLYVRTEMYNSHDEYIATYTDICRPVQLVNGIFSFEDMYLDIWHPAGGKRVLLDEDELAAAIDQGFILPAEAIEAISVARQLLRDS